ncbi:MAG: hypothetical protein U1F68_06365 [Gammaproteobacteria bacterium]
MKIKGFPLASATFCLGLIIGHFHALWTQQTGSTDADRITATTPSLREKALSLEALNDSSETIDHIDPVSSGHSHAPMANTPRHQFTDATMASDLSTDEQASNLEADYEQALRELGVNEYDILARLENWDHPTEWEFEPQNTPNPYPKENELSVDQLRSELEYALTEMGIGADEAMASADHLMDEITVAPAATHIGLQDNIDSAHEEAKQQEPATQ